ncbi:glycosyltransferase family 2 protein [Salinisphaera sp. Q1T1-3]|uniref:glycosyltransferase family 2 protein n=1 Tax=Salinisphaera sp. Q1T1-3 TaxID=2321229 RepID=UPI001314ACF2|nr:glycosyltransferase family 2 protein [Salinisphaera sp. Q1T1-3]
MSDPADRAPRRPAISVVFATRDRAVQLRETLAAYRAVSSSDLEWELVVADNGSTDATAEVLTAAGNDLPLISLHVGEPGKNRALNVALAHVGGDLVVFTDDDVIPAPDCLHAYLAASRRWPSDAIFGARVVPRFPIGTPDWLASPAFEFGTTAFARYEPASAEGPVSRHPYGPSFAVRRSAMTDHRFPEHLGPQGNAYAMGGEAGFLRTLAADGHRYIYVPEARVEHVVRDEQIHEAWLVRRARNKGRGQVYLPSRKKPRRLFVAGAPLRLWLATARAALRYGIARLTRNTKRRVRYGVKYALRAGELDERRRRRRTPID